MTPVVYNGHLGLKLTPKVNGNTTVDSKFQFSFYFVIEKAHILTSS